MPHGNEEQIVLDSNSHQLQESESKIEIGSRNQGNNSRSEEEGAAAIDRNSVGGFGTVEGRRTEERERG